MENNLYITIKWEHNPNPNPCFSQWKALPLGLRQVIKTGIILYLTVYSAINEIPNASYLKVPHSSQFQVFIYFFYSKLQWSSLEPLITPPSY